jgi:hypothetical protein
MSTGRANRPGLFFCRASDLVAGCHRLGKQRERHRGRRRISEAPLARHGLLRYLRPDDNIQAVGNLSDERHEAEDTTPKGEP